MDRDARVLPNFMNKYGQGKSFVYTLASFGSCFIIGLCKKSFDI